MKKKNTYFKIISLLSAALIISAAWPSFADSSQDQPPVAVNQALPEDSNIAKKVEILHITDAWARKSMSSSSNSAAYMKITNPTDKQITIIGASASMIANNVELHKSFVDEKGVSRMTSIDKIVVPANSAIELAPGGIHIMLLDLKRILLPGDKFDIAIKIEGQEPQIVNTIVKSQ